MKPTEGDVFIDSDGVFYRVKFVSPDDERIILSRFDDENIITTATYIDGMERIYPKPPLSDADIDRIAERMLAKFLEIQQ